MAPAADGGEWSGPLGCPRCGSTLERQRSARPGAGAVACPVCGWTEGERVAPHRVPVGSRAFECGSVRSNEVGSLRFDDLSAADADVLASLAAGELDAAVARIGGETLASGDAAARIAAAMRWLETRLPDGPWPDLTGSWRVADAAAVPYWCWFRDGASMFVPLGLEACLDIDSVGAVVTREILDANAGSAITRSAAGKDHVHFRKPVVRLASGGEIWPIGRVQGMAHRLVTGTRAVDIAESVHRLDPWLGATTRRGAS